MEGQNVQLRDWPVNAHEPFVAKRERVRVGPYVPAAQYHVYVFPFSIGVGLIINDDGG